MDNPASEAALSLHDPLEKLRADHELVKKLRPKLSTEELAAEKERFRLADEADALHRKNARIAWIIGDLEKQLGARYSRAKTELNAYQIYDKRQGEAFKRVLGIAEKLEEFVSQGRNLVFFGTVGTGKDHLLAHLLYRAASIGKTCRYANGQELFSRFRGTMDKEAHESERDVLADFTGLDVIGISDPLPPSGQNSDWRREIFYRLLDKRYRAMKSTWITANVTMATADASFSEPVWDRMQHEAEIITCDWQSFRERKKQ